MALTTPVLVFDIETIPDVATGKRVYDIKDGLSDTDAMQALIALRQAESGSDFMRQPLHKIACLSFLWVDNGVYTLKSLSLNDMDERTILTTFLRAFQKERRPMLVSWNGAVFDLPVLLYRMLHHRLNASDILRVGSNKAEYVGRYTAKHIDLMDKFAFDVWGGKQKLDLIASLCGFAGKGETTGADVLPMVQAGEWEKLTTYCESDVLNTWLLYLRYLHLYGKISDEELSDFEHSTQAFLGNLTDSTGKVRHQAFLEAWS